MLWVQAESNTSSLLKLCGARGHLGSDCHRDEKGPLLLRDAGLLGWLLGPSTSFLVSGGTYTEAGAGPCSGMLVLKEEVISFLFWEENESPISLTAFPGGRPCSS